MKKRMFITTIVMMLVLAIALTTSSLAWFSSANQSVTANAATFTAGTNSSTQKNLKISDTTAGWSNNINLSMVDGNGSLSPLVPTAPLVAGLNIVNNELADYVTPGTFPDASNLSTNIPVSHKGYVWPATISFNGAKVGSESNFIIDATNPVVTPAARTNGNETDYFYREFYIHNAGSTNPINSLTFRVNADLSSTGSDYTATGFAAFIVFDEMHYAKGDTIPANALEGAGTSVTADEGANAWIPFAAFTFATDKGNTDIYKETDRPGWQYANFGDTTHGVVLATKTNGHYAVGTYYEADGTAFEVTNENKESEETDAKVLYKYKGYNGVRTDELYTQMYESLTVSSETTTGGFVLNSENLQILNNKTVAANGNVSASATRTEYADSTSVFIMQPRETFKVAFYYWLDGYTVTEYTDTTATLLEITISAN